MSSINNLHQDYYEKLEKGVDRLIQRFIKTPYSYYSENDLHCEQYRIFNNIGLNKSCIIKVGRKKIQSKLLHREYPTKGRYKRVKNGPSLKVKRGKRGHYDLCLWDSELTEKRQFERAGGKGEQRTKAAIEISLNEHHNQFQWHVYWDLLKLSDPENEIQTRIILFFLRDYPYKKTKFSQNGFLSKLHLMFGKETKTHIIYVESNQDENQIWLISDTSFGNYKKYPARE
jgi:hypothetical protein